jgi:AraC-like DNA-binding protein
MRKTSQHIEHPASRLECRVVRCYEGAPFWPKGEFRSENVVVWHLLAGSVRVRQGGMETYAKAGSGLFIPPGWRFHQFSSDAQILSAILLVQSDGAIWSGPPILKFPSPAGFLQAFRRLVRQPAPSVPLGEVQRQKALWNFLAALFPVLTRNAVGFSPVASVNPRVEESRRLLDRVPLDMSWNRFATAAAARVSASQLDRLWREFLGETPHQYWERRRRRYACEQLESSSRPIKEIAIELGFMHLSQFSNWFRKAIGHSPRQFRQKYPS